MYKLFITQFANADLEAACAYMDRELKNPSAADAFLENIGACYDRLKSDPLLYERSRDARLAAEGYRRAIVGKYILLYKVDEAAQAVTVYRLFYGPSDYTKLI
jgi:plasmid stabilization system protein ParE